MVGKPLRGILTGDWHCGHVVGLTPPSWDSDEPKGSVHGHGKWAMRRAIWEWAEQEIHALPVPDFVLLNGDAIDGKGVRSGGTEQLTADWDEQVEMADHGYRELFYRRAKRPRLYMSYGTPYHTGRDSDYENGLARNLSAEHIAGEHSFDVRGLVVNHKHAISSSQIPHGRFTALGRDWLWNTLWSLRGEYAQAALLVRSHVHYYAFAGGVGWAAMSLPSLQGYGSKFGSRIPSGTVDVGFVSIEVYDRDNWNWRPHIWRAEFKAPAVVEWR